MQVIVTNQFEKDASKELDKNLQIRLAEIIEGLQSATSLQDLPNLKKLKGYKNYFRIKLSDYRIGFVYESNEITLCRVMHRREIYRYFP